MPLSSLIETNSQSWTELHPNRPHWAAKPITYEAIDRDLKMELDQRTLTTGPVLKATSHQNRIVSRVFDLQLSNVWWNTCDSH